MTAKIPDQNLAINGFSQNYSIQSSHAKKRKYTTDHIDLAEVKPF